VKTLDSKPLETDLQQRGLCYATSMEQGGARACRVEDSRKRYLRPCNQRNETGRNGIDARSELDSRQE
jgi:hypothetical protein